MVCLAGINKAREDNIGGVASFLWLYEPEAFDGKGRCAITIGDPDTADNTVMLVAGLEAKVDNRMGNPDAVHVFNEAHYADPTHSTVVVNWMGYNAPGFSNVAVDHAAKHGATLLASDAGALRATHQGAPTDLTLIGDSYGSITVADSIADDGLRADNVVLTAAPAWTMRASHQRWVATATSTSAPRLTIRSPTSHTMSVTGNRSAMTPP